MKRVCLAGFGSAGDVHPLLALGRHLSAEGRRVAVVTNPHFAGAVVASGLEFLPAGELADYQAAAAHPKLWHPIDGFGVMWRYLLRPALAPTYEQVAKFAQGGDAVVVASPVAMGARVAQERLGLPLATVYTAATQLRTVHDPMTLAQWRVPPWLPRGARRLAWAALDRHKLQPLALPALEALRRPLGLPAIRGSVFGEWMHSPTAGLALFPPWFAPRPPDWPAQVAEGGFPLHDDAGAAWPEGLEPFLAAGEPPVVFMPGTAQRRARAFFEAAIAACARSGCRGLLLGALDADLAGALPRGLHAQPYADFPRLLPRARALVHHGGIGTCAQALRAGIPQLVLPSAYDQFDNAMRLEMLGVGASLPATAAGHARLGEALQALLASGDVAQACARWAARTDPAPVRRALSRLLAGL